MKSYQAPDQQWKSISMDFIIDLPKWKESDAVLIVIDWLMKMPHFFPCAKQMNLWQFSQLVVREIFRVHRLPCYGVASTVGFRAN